VPHDPGRHRSFGCSLIKTVIPSGSHDRRLHARDVWRPSTGYSKLRHVRPSRLLFMSALSRLKLHCLRAAGADRHRPSEATMMALLLDGLSQTDR
jgi:hypothetical protein